MGSTSLEFFSGVLLVSKDPERLAAFYRDVLDVPHDEWFEMLSERRNKGLDIVDRWKAEKKGRS